ncbi:MlaA family lipoprotein [Muricoccus aerilatus]|uniref:MlaA family lipoprotein n=1 Tax=Muricoccus aerilatus TaxID=452982 RepID=UPI0006941A33|nr:VacJ family lipoprotein [Roseomonas aerilata]
MLARLLPYASAMIPRILLSLALAASLGACATRGGDAEMAATPGDPLEPTNRQVLDVNMAVDDAVIRPVAQGYRAAVPAYARTRIRNVLDNMQEPRIFANNVLQGRFLDAGHTTMRFFFNSTVGVAGLYDVATDFGIARRTGDFGQTLNAWGLEDGPYLMLPIAGPSNVRDTVGMVGDGFLNPISWLLPFGGNAARAGVSGVDLREQNIESLDALRGESLDFYARLRSVWQQRRNAELGRTDDTGDRLDVLQDPGAAPTPVPAAR